MSARNPSNRIPKEERRREILECATRLFSAKGFQDTTMDDVAAAASITKRTLYRYVQTKEQLLFEIHDEFSGSSLLNAPLETGNPVERFRQLVWRHVEVVTSQPMKIAVFFDERKHLAHPQQREIHDRRAAYESLALDAMVDAKNAGKVDVVDERVATQLILGSLTEIYRWYRPEGRLSPEKICTIALDSFFQGILRDSAGNEALSRVGEAIDEGAKIRNPLPYPVDAEAKVRHAAIKSFARLGYGAASIRELAENAEVTKGAVMYHARQKHKLLDEIITTTMTDGIGVLTAASDRGGDPVILLTRLLATQLAFIADRHDEIAIANENLQYLKPARYRRVVQLRRQWAGNVETAVDAGISAGVFSTEDEFLLKKLIIGMLNSTYRWFRPSPTMTVEHLATVMTQVLLRGLAARSR